MSLPTSWHFEPSEAELSSVSGLSEFESLLLAKLVHILRLGLHFNRLTRKEEVTPIGGATPSAESCEKFVQDAIGNWTAADKFFPLRLTAPSLLLITELIPNNEASPISIFKICVQRIFGVGSEGVIRSLDKFFLGFGDVECWDALVGSNFESLNKIIQEDGAGPEKITRPVYGQLMVTRKHVPEMLKRLWTFAKEIYNMDGATRSFENVKNRLGTYEVPTIPKHGLLSWLIPSDLAEWKICAFPKIETLAEHVDGDSPSGPKEALTVVVRIIFEARVEARGGVYIEPNFSGAMINVWRLLENPPAGCVWLKTLMEQCQAAQGRPISVVDLEHLLCKISRYASKTQKKSGKKSKKAAKKKAEEQSEEEAEEEVEEEPKKKSKRSTKRSAEEFEQ